MVENLATRMIRHSTDSMSERELMLYRFGNSQLQWLLSNFDNNELEQDSRSFEFSDGSLIRVSHSHGESNIEVYVPPPEELDISSIVMEVVNSGRVYLETRKDDFDKWTEPAQTLHWVFSRKQFDELVDEAITKRLSGMPTDEQRFMARMAAIAEFEDKESLIGDNVVLVPFDFDEIEQYCPVHPTFGFRTTSMIDGDCVEAKSFDTKDFIENESIDDEDDNSKRYVAYSCGGLICSDDKSVIIEPKSFKRDYQQFHIINNIMIWFGEVKRADPGNMNVHYDLNCKTYKINTDDGSITLLGSFSHGDYRGLLDGLHHRMERTDPPDCGNILSCLRPGVPFAGVKDVTDDEITLFVPYATDMRYCEYGGQGGSMQITYNHDGQDYDRNGDYKTMNKRGFLASSFQGFIWGNEAKSVRGGPKFEEKHSPDPLPYVDDISRSTFKTYSSTTIVFPKLDVFFSEHAFNQSYGDVMLDGYAKPWRTYAKDSNTESASCFLLGSQGYCFTTRGGFLELWWSREATIPNRYSATSGFYDGWCPNCGSDGYPHCWHKQREIRSDNCWDGWGGNPHCFSCEEYPNLSIITTFSLPQPSNYTPEKAFPLFEAVAVEYKDKTNWNYGKWHDGIKPTDCFIAVDTCEVWRGFFILDGFKDVVLATTDVDTGDLEGREDVVSQRTHEQYDYPGMTWKDKLDLLRSSYSSGYGAWPGATDAHGWNNTVLLYEKNGFVIKLTNKDTIKLSCLVVAFDETFSKKFDGVIHRRAIGLEPQGVYATKYAFMDDRACGGPVIFFAGMSDDYELTSGDRELVRWEIGIYENHKYLDVKSEVFDLLGFEEADVNAIIGMGMF